MKSPWKITVHAVRQYLKWTCRRDDRVDFERARDELIELACECVTSDRTPKELDNGSIQYGGALPLRLRYIVIPPPRLSNDLPTLVDVLPDYVGRAGAYRRSGHHEQQLNPKVRKARKAERGK